MTVKRIGGSLAVVIPRAVAAESKLGVGTPLQVTTTADGILLQPAARRPRRSVADLARRMSPARYARRNADVLADPPAGKEA